MTFLTERIEIIYSEKQWDLFRSLREEAAVLMKPLAAAHIECFTYGSVARGDVKLISDVDIFLPNPPAPEFVEMILERGGIRITERSIIQATPNYAAKGYLYTSDRRGFSLPLTSLLPAEREFYSFAGAVTLTQINEKRRVLGVDKRLMLIEPTSRGHTESLVAGREGTVAKLLRVDTRIVMERVRTLKRRRQVGRTGVYLKYPLDPNEGFSEALNHLSIRRPALRKRMEK